MNGILALGIAAVLLVSAYGLTVFAEVIFRHAPELLSVEGRLPARRRTLVRRFADNPHDLFLVAELYNSAILVVNAALGWLAGPWWAENLGLPTLWTRIGFVAIVWLTHALVIELLPQTIDRETVAVRLPRWLGPVNVVWAVFWPMRLAARLLRRRFVQRIGEEERMEERIVERAIETLADSVGVREPIIEEDEREMIENIFALDTTEVREIMVPRVDIVAIDDDMTLADVRRVVNEQGHSRLPYVGRDLDDVRGIIYVKDLFRRRPEFDLPARDEDKVEWKQVARPALFVPESKKLDTMLEELKRGKTHLAIVVDEYGGTAGLVTMEDILEEIVGEIADEHDPESLPITEIQPGVVEVHGVVSIADLARALDLDLPNGEFETVGGAIYDQVGGVPKVGQIVETLGLRFTIRDIVGQRIKSVRVEEVRPLADDAETA